MGRNAEHQIFYPWAGGLVTAVDPIIANPDNIQQADNIQFTNSGSRRKRGGQVRFNTARLSTATALIYLTDYWATVSNVKRSAGVVVRANANASTAAAVYRSVSWVSSAFTNFNTTALKADLGNITSTVFNNDLVMGFKGNGTVCIRVWNDQSTASNLVIATASSGTLPGRGWIVKEYRRRLFVAGDGASPDTLYFSKVADRTAWSGTGNSKGGNLVIGTENDKDPDGITAILPGIGGEPAIYVAKRLSIYRIDMSSADPDNWAVSVLTEGIGVINPNAVAAVDQSDVLFCSDRGVHSLSQLLSGTAYKEGDFLSAPIDNDYKTVIDQDQKGTINMCWYPPLNSVLIAVKRDADSTAQCVYAFNVELAQWYRWLATPSNHLAPRFNGTTKSFQLYNIGERPGLASSDRGFINLMDQERKYDFTVSTPITTVIKSMDIYAGNDIINEKAFLNLGLLYRSRDTSNITAQYQIDNVLQIPSLTYRQAALGNFILGSSILGVGILGATAFGIKPNWQNIKGVGHCITVTITHDTADSDMEIFAMLLEFQGAGESQNAFRKIGS